MELLLGISNESESLPNKNRFNRPTYFVQERLHDKNSDRRKPQVLQHA